MNGFVAFGGLMCRELQVKEAMKTAKIEMSGKMTGSVGELVVLFYDHFIGLFDDPELASVATATTINELLSEAQEHGDGILKVA